MNVIKKSTADIEKVRIAGKLAAKILKIIEPHVKPGVTTLELNNICHDYIVNVQQAIPASLNYRGYPKSVCTSVNHVVCHGIPKATEILKDGDIINIDVTVAKNGYLADTSKTFGVGQLSIFANKLLQITEESLFIGINEVKPGIRLGKIGSVIQKYVEKNNFSVVREYCGHGIGKSFHEPPSVLHYGSPSFGPTLHEGMIFTIEPMVNAGSRHIKILNDGWTAVTADHQLSAQYEHTILVTKDGYEILTLDD